MAVEPKVIRCYVYPVGETRGQFVKIPTVTSRGGIADIPHLASIGMGYEEVYQKPVLLSVDSPDGTHEEIVFLVCCTWNLPAGGYNKALYAADSKLYWPGEVAVFRAAQGSCSCRLVNMRTDDQHVALWAVQLALSSIIDEVGEGYDGDAEYDGAVDAPVARGVIEAA